MPVDPQGYITNDSGTRLGGRVDLATGKVTEQGGGVDSYDPKTFQTTSTGGDAFGNKGNWMSNPDTGINEFVSMGGKPSWQKLVSPTTLSSDTSKYTAEDESRMKDLQNKGGTYVDQQGYQRYRYDQSLVPAPFDSTQEGGGYSAGGFTYGAAPEYSKDLTENALFASMKNNLDRTTASVIDSIHQNATLRKQQVEDINKRQQASLGQSLLLGGGARYAQISSQGLLSEQERYGVMQLNAIDAEENKAISEARSAQSKGQYDIMSKALDKAERLRQEKTQRAQTISDRIEAERKAKETENFQSQKESAIASVISPEDGTQGISDPAKILQTVRAKGFNDVNIKDVNSVLESISKNMGMDLSKATNAIEAFGSFSKNNQLPADILALPTKAEQLLEFSKRFKEANEGMGTVKWQKVGTDKFGDDVYGFVNEKTGQITYPGGKTQAANIGGGKGAIAGITAPPEEYKTFLEGKSPQQIETFTKLNDQEKTNVMGLINGDILLSDIAKGGIKGSKAAQVYNAEAKQIDSTYSENANKQRYAFKIKWNDSNGKAYQVRTGVNTALGHLSRLKELTDGLANNGNFQKANNLGNWIASNINSSKHSDPNNPNSPTLSEVLGQFQDTVSLLSMEIARAYKGGVPDQNEIDRQVASINAMQPKNVLSSIINNKVNLMTGLLASQGEEYKKVMGDYPKDSIVNPDALSSLKTAGVDTSKIEAKISHQIPKGGISIAPLGDSSTKIKNFRAQSPENDSLAQKIREAAPNATPDEIAKMLGL